MTKNEERGIKGDNCMTPDAPMGSFSGGPSGTTAPTLTSTPGSDPAVEEALDEAALAMNAGKPFKLLGEVELDGVMSEGHGRKDKSSDIGQ